jgi:hypothetical protein
MRPVLPNCKSWKEARLQDLVFFQRGFDITKEQQQVGEIPVISSSGVQSYHSEAKVVGPGVIIGRKGSLGTVHSLRVDTPRLAASGRCDKLRG